MSQTLIIGHRGAPEHAAANTLSSFKKARELGADMIELDVRQAGDSSLIVFHDERISGKLIRDMTFQEVVESGKRIGIDIPSFESTLLFTCGRIKLDIEIKEPGYEQQILELSSKYCSPNDFIISSFNWDSIETIKKINPPCQVGLILGKKPPGLSGFSNRISKSLQARIISEKTDLLIVHWKLLDLPQVSELIRKQQKNILVWTVNSRTRVLKYLKDEGIKGIITDKPGMARLISLKASRK